MSVRNACRAAALGTLGIVALWRASLAAAPVQDQDLRVATIGHRLAESGAPRCSRQAPLTGLLLHDLAAYDAPVRPAIVRRFGLGIGMGVRQVVVGSSADRAGLRAGDEILTFNGVPVADLPLPLPQEEASYDRVEAFLELVTAALEEGDVMLSIQRAGASETARMSRRRGCAVRFALLAGDKPEAWSDGRYAAVNQALAQGASDDELAFALAHEMAHVVLSHAQKRPAMLESLGVAGGKTRAQELDADRLGAQIMVDAGYALHGAEAFLQRIVRAHGGLSLTHPSIKARIEAIQDATKHSAITRP